MRRLVSFVVVLIMPLILIVGGSAIMGWGITNDWDIIGWIGLGMIAAGIIWGFFLFFWASDGGW